MTTQTTRYLIGLAILMLVIPWITFYVGYEKGAASVVMPVLDPIKDFGAVCDSKNDDTMAFENATKVGANHGLAVQVPNNCTVSNLFAPSSSEERGDSSIYGGHAAISVGKNSSITTHGTTLNSDDCVVIKDGVCLKLSPDWTGNMTTDENGEMIINGRKMSDFPSCDKVTTTNCTEKRP